MEIEIISSIFSDHNVMRLDVNYKGKTVRNTSTWRFHNTSLNNQQATEDKKGNQKYSRNKWQWKHDNLKPVDAATAILREKFIAIQSYLKKQEKHWIDNLTLYLKQLEKEEQQQKKLAEGKKS